MSHTYNIYQSCVSALPRGCRRVVHLSWSSSSARRQHQLPHWQVGLWAGRKNYIDVDLEGNHLIRPAGQSRGKTWPCRRRLARESLEMWGLVNIGNFWFYSPVIQIWSYLKDVLIVMFCQIKGGKRWLWKSWSKTHLLLPKTFLARRKSWRE